MLLKTHGRMTAAAIAAELEVSERTVLRDIDALSVSGVPVYAERGRHGGFALLPGYRTDLSGLTLDEATSLLAGGGRLDSPAFTSAMRKVAASIPDSHRARAVRAAQRILVRPEGFVRDPVPVDALAPVQQAVFDGRRIRVDYQARSATEPRSRVLDPFGLIVAGETWYLVANVLVTQRDQPREYAERMYRISRMSNVEILDEPAYRDDTVDLDAVWDRRRSEFRSGFEELDVTVRCAPDSVARWRVHARAAEVSESRDDRVDVRLTFADHRHALRVLWMASTETRFEVLTPNSVREELAEWARRAADDFSR